MSEMGATENSNAVLDTALDAAGGLQRSREQSSDLTDLEEDAPW
jgi:hypothetical protein